MTSLSILFISSFDFIGLFNGCLIVIEYLGTSLLFYITTSHVLLGINSYFIQIFTWDIYQKDRDKHRMSTLRSVRMLYINT